MLLGLLELLPNKVLLFLKKYLSKGSNFVELIDRVRLDKYIEETDFARLDVEDRPACLITDAEWDYPLLNICFLENILKNVVYCLANGYRPVIMFRNSASSENMWEMLFRQPFAQMRAGKQDGIRCDVKAAPIYFPIFPKYADIVKYGELYKSFVCPNEQFKMYWEGEYQELLQGKRVLGVLCRGTDYVATKPKGHPIQPAIEDVIALVKEKMNELNCEYIYLATEENAIYKQFQAVFPNRVITNQRKYYDEYYSLHNQDQRKLISAVHFDRENDSYNKSREYFSSLYLLSRCNALIAGSCGGSRAALYLNYGEYEYWHLFNLGVYE